MRVRATMARGSVGVRGAAGVHSHGMDLSTFEGEGTCTARGQ